MRVSLGQHSVVWTDGCELGLTLVLVEGSGGGSEEGSEDSGRELHLEQLRVVGELNEVDWRREVWGVNN